MTRAVLVGTNAYPFLMRFWYELFVKYWQDEVDTVYIAVSEPEHHTTWKYIRDLLSRHPKIRVIRTGINWPKSINQVAQTITEDSILVMHDDTFVFQSGIVDKYFKIVENTGKIVTPITPIFTPKDLVEELMVRKFPDQVPFASSDTTDTGYSFYCNFFFMPKALFDKTTKDFGAYVVEVSDYCEYLDWTPLVRPINSDTNFKLCLELLAKGAQFHPIERMEIANIYNNPDPIQSLWDMQEAGTGPFNPDAGWIHLQSMAYHIHDLYYDLGVRETLQEKSGGQVLPKIHEKETEFGIAANTWSLTTRLAWLHIFMNEYEYNDLNDYWQHARKQIAYIIEAAGVDPDSVDQFIKIFRQLIGITK